MNGFTTILLSASALATAACSRTDGDTGEPDSNVEATSAGRAENHNNPFSTAETEMRQQMMVAVGGNAAETWVRKMIEHHRGAIAMSQSLIHSEGDPTLTEMARADVEEQQRELGELQRILTAGIPSRSNKPNPFGPAEQSMHQQMSAATGADLSETWARKMIAHHRGAVAMAEILIWEGGNPQVVEMARDVAANQSRKIEVLENRLNGVGGR